MFRFEEPSYSVLFIIIPILVGLFLWTRIISKRYLKKYATSNLHLKLAPKTSPYKPTVKLILILLAIGLVIVGILNPQWGTKRIKTQRKSLDVFIALDISKSMYATDIRPNRMERAKNFAEVLIEKIKGDRIGTIIFSGNAYLQMPVTSDYAAAKMFMKSAHPGQVPAQGTAIGEAIKLASASFEENNKNHKAIIVISDGENHEGTAITEAENAHEAGAIIYTIGVGEKSGGFIPSVQNGQVKYKTDENGNPVKTKLDEKMLADIAAAGGGKYWKLSNNNALIKSLKKEISTIEKREYEESIFSKYESYYQYFLMLALLFLIIEFMLSYGKSKWLKGKDIFKI